MTKVVIRYFDYSHFKRTGQSYEAGIFEDSFEVAHPFTDKPIPEELKSPEKVAFFNPQTQEWEDRSSDAEIAAAKKQQEDLAIAKQDAADAKAENAKLKDTVTTVKGALKELMTYVSILSAADTTSTTTSTQGGKY